MTFHQIHFVYISSTTRKLIQCLAPRDRTRFKGRITFFDSSADQKLFQITCKVDSAHLIVRRLRGKCFTKPIKKSWH